jgi:hypothetical protein
MLTYPPSSFDRDRMIAAIKSIGKRELKREARSTDSSPTCRWPSPRPGAKSTNMSATWTLAAGLNEAACVRAQPVGLHQPLHERSTTIQSPSAGPNPATISSPP